MSRADIIGEISACGLRGRGGAGFPTGVKWNLAAAAKVKAAGQVRRLQRRRGRAGHLQGPGHPLRPRRPGVRGDDDRGARHRRDHRDPLPAGRVHLPAAASRAGPQRRRAKKLLGKNIRGQAGFNFDIHIHMGAGAYVCGEETALIESLEGHRGEPRNRPPFPVDTGFMGHPTVVNNVETFAWASASWPQGAVVQAIGTAKSTGSSSSACRATAREPGVYEFPLGITVGELLEEVGGAGRQGGAGRRRVGPLRPGVGVRPAHRVRGRLHRRFDHRVRPGPRHAGGRAELHGVLRRGILRPVHAVPRRQRQAARGRRDAASGASARWPTCRS